MNLPSDVLEYIVLFTCKDSASYGYEVVSRIEEFSCGCWSPSTGTVYPLIDRMVEDGLLERVNSESVDEGDSDRNYFVISDKGMDKLEDAQDNMDEYKGEFRDLILGYVNLYAKFCSNEEFDSLVEEVNGVESLGKTC